MIKRFILRLKARNKYQDRGWRCEKSIEEQERRRGGEADDSRDQCILGIVSLEPT